jgi:hypothetical protein
MWSIRCNAGDMMRRSILALIDPASLALARALARGPSERLRGCCSVMRFVREGEQRQLRNNRGGYEAHSATRV